MKNIIYSTCVYIYFVAGIVRVYNIVYMRELENHIFELLYFSFKPLK